MYGPFGQKTQGFPAVRTVRSVDTGRRPAQLGGSPENVVVAASLPPRRRVFPIQETSMPKSKNRRKSKKQAGAAPSGGQAPVIESAGSDQERAQSAGASTTSQKSKVGMVQFFRQVRDEGLKVTWTTRKETMVSSIMVLIMVAIASVFFFFVDQILRWLTPILLGLGG